MHNTHIRKQLKFMNKVFGSTIFKRYLGYKKPELLRRHIICLNKLIDRLFRNSYPNTYHSHILIVIYIYIYIYVCVCVCVCVCV